MRRYVAQTARRLHVHRTTVPYRIVRLAEDFGVDLENRLPG
jgi:DNA-binding PucR family transcriptional regulator